MGIIAFIFCLFRFPKQTFILIGLFIFVYFLFWCFAINLPDQERKELHENVLVSTKYDISQCGLEYPLHVIITNNIKKTVNKITWNLDVYVPGYRSDLSGYNDDYKCDKILEPGEKYTSCYSERIAPKA